MHWQRTVATEEVLRRITSSSLETVADAIADHARRGRPHCVTTTNLSHLRYLENEPEFGRSYLKADIVTADGWPVVVLCTLRSRRRIPRVTGADLLTLVLERLGAGEDKIVLFGGSPESCEKFLDQHKRELVTHIDVGPEETKTLGACVHLVEALAGTLPQAGLAVISMSAPRQEFLAAALRERTDLSILPCGAGLDFATGTRRRAPELLQRVGLEWVFRIALEPRRLAPRYYADLKALIAYLRHRGRRRHMQQ